MSKISFFHFINFLVVDFEHLTDYIYKELIIKNLKDK